MTPPVMMLLFSILNKSTKGIEPIIRDGSLPNIDFFNTSSTDHGAAELDFSSINGRRSVILKADAQFGERNARVDGFREFFVESGKVGRVGAHRHDFVNIRFAQESKIPDRIPGSVGHRELLTSGVHRIRKLIHKSGIICSVLTRCRTSRLPIDIITGKTLIRCAFQKKYGQYEMTFLIQMKKGLSNQHPSGN